MLSIKSVRQKHQASNDLLKLLDEFRRMVNVCVAIGIEENISTHDSLVGIVSSSQPRHPRLLQTGSDRHSHWDSSQLSESCEEEPLDKGSIC